ncbi:MAG TPA: class I SAM-dependent methyltransferase [Thermomicrobiales bacterium]|jgi:SAM-dependent methyltransferase|nr:class I SAM-dependent methyltransferase [Thermomicrobiales bacterium]
MFEKSAAYYDAIFGRRHDYRAETERLHRFIQANKRSRGNRLLDVACGTGSYLTQLRDSYQVEGLDLSEAMLDVARQRVPDVPLHQGDLVDFKLERRFDAVVCLGSSIGYARSVAGLRQAIQTFADHMVDGGAIVVEPWFPPGVWEPGRLTADLVDEPDLKVARVLVSGVDDTGLVSTLDIHHLVAAPAGVETFVERHELGLFTHAAYMAAFENAGLTVRHDPEGLIGRGMYVGAKG